MVHFMCRVDWVTAAQVLGWTWLLSIWERVSGGGWSQSAELSHLPPNTHTGPQCGGASAHPSRLTEDRRAGRGGRPRAAEPPPCPSRHRRRRVLRDADSPAHSQHPCCWFRSFRPRIGHRHHQLLRVSSLQMADLGHPSLRDHVSRFQTTDLSTHVHLCVCVCVQS